MVIFEIVVVVLLVFVVLGISGLLPFGRRSHGAKISAALKELLLARAEGRINGEEFERRQAELHASLLNEPQEIPMARRRHLRWAIPAAIALITLPPIVIYIFLGKPKVVTPLPSPVFSSGLPITESMTPSQTNSGGDLNMVVKRLADKMLNDPGNGEGWLLLARTYGELHQFKEAAHAYAKAAALLPPNAVFLTEWADTHVLANERKWDDESHKIVQQALAADPKNLKALALAGSEAFYHADYKQAVSYWKRMKAVALAGSNDAKLAEMNIQEANTMLAGIKPD